MGKYIFTVSQARKQNWVIEVEAASEEEARDTLQYGFDEDHGFFYEDTEGLTVLEDDGPVSEYEGLVIENVEAAK